MLGWFSRHAWAVHLSVVAVGAALLVALALAVQAGGLGDWLDDRILVAQWLT